MMDEERFQMEEEEYHRVRALPFFHRCFTAKHDLPGLKKREPLFLIFR